MIYSVTFHHDAQNSAFYATCSSLFSSFLIVWDTIGLAGNSPAQTGVMESSHRRRVNDFIPSPMFENQNLGSV